MQKFTQIASIIPKSHLTHDFVELAKELYGHWLIHNDDKQYEILEAEFLFQTKSTIHNDPFMDGGKGQWEMAKWYLPAGGGVDITFGCDDYAAAIFLRRIKNIETGLEVVGPTRIFSELFQEAGSVIDGRSGVIIKRRERPVEVSVFAVPRANLPVEHRSKDLERRLRYVFRPYRIIRSDVVDYIEKYVGDLYLSQVQGIEMTSMKLSAKKRDRYLRSFDLGQSAPDIEQVWQQSNPSLRLAALMGYLSVNQKEDLK